MNHFHNNRIARLLALLILLALLTVFAAPAPAASPAAMPAAVRTTYYVSNTNDSGAGSLREAITLANAHAGPDVIRFTIPICSPSCAITLLTALPALSTGDTLIDGYSQPGASPADDENPSTIKIELDGHLIPSVANGLTITSAGNLIKGLAITRFIGNGVYINGAAATGNMIYGNHIGVTPAAELTMGNLLDGVFIGGGATDNRVGGDTHAERNIIGGNGWDGVGIYGIGSDRNVVSGNYIGTNGADPLGNNLSGVHIYGGTKDNIVGGDTLLERNLISGNGASGVSIDGSSHNRIGGNTSAGANTISGNGECGVKITNGSLSNELRFNRIGTSLSEMVALGNDSHGVLVEEASQENIIGGADDSGGNLISGNLGDGVRIQGTDTNNNQVLGNLIGSQPHTFSDLGNAGNGITIMAGASENTVGGHGYLVYNNYGVMLIDDGTMNNVITETWIADSDFGGVYITGGAKANTIGPGNMIRSSGTAGVWIEAPDTFANVVTLNAIGENTGAGINLEGGANHDIQPPVIAAITGNTLSLQVSGASCAGCIVEVFGNRAADGEGEMYIDSDVADAGGNWSLALERLFYPYLTATATAVLDGTSEFSVAFANPYRYVFMPLMIK